MKLNCWSIPWFSERSSDEDRIRKNTRKLKKREVTWMIARVPKRTSVQSSNDVVFAISLLLPHSVSPTNSTSETGNLKILVILETQFVTQTNDCVTRNNSVDIVGFDWLDLEQVTLWAIWALVFFFLTRLESESKYHVFFFGLRKIKVYRSIRALTSLKILWYNLKLKKHVTVQ